MVLKLLKRRVDMLDAVSTDLNPSAEHTTSGDVTRDPSFFSKELSSHVIVQLSNSIYFCVSNADYS